MGDQRIGTEHLLLGLFGETSDATRALAALGLDQQRIHAEITRLRSGPRPDPS
jgi:hypothetical protein